MLEKVLGHAIEKKAETIEFTHLKRVMSYSQRDHKEEQKRVLNQSELLKSIAKKHGYTQDPKESWIFTKVSTANK